jgi:hypothetical protein
MYDATKQNPSKTKIKKKKMFNKGEKVSVLDEAEWCSDCC